MRTFLVIYLVLTSGRSFALEKLRSKTNIRPHQIYHCTSQWKCPCDIPSKFKPYTPDTSYVNMTGNIENVMKSVDASLEAYVSKIRK